MTLIALVAASIRIEAATSCGDRTPGECEDDRRPGISNSQFNVTLAATSDAVWTAAGPYRIDAKSGAVTGPFTTGTENDVGVGDGSVWVSDYHADLVHRLDASTGKQVAVIKLPKGGNPEGIAVTQNAVWVAEHHLGNVTRIDPKTNRIVATVLVGPPGDGGPQEVAFGFGSLWADVPNNNSLVRVDPKTNTIAAFVTFPSNMIPCGGIAIGRTAVWVTGCPDVKKKIARVDPKTNAIASILAIGGGAYQAYADRDTVWFVAGADPDNSPNAPAYLMQLRADDTVARRIALSRGFVSGGLTVAFGSVWFSDLYNPVVIRLPDPR